MAKATENKETKKDAAYYSELVTVKLFKDNDKYKDDVFVAVNGGGIIVPRGKEVPIPRKYAIALKVSTFFRRILLWMSFFIRYILIKIYVRVVLTA